MVVGNGAPSVQETLGLEQLVDVIHLFIESLGPQARNRSNLKKLETLLQSVDAVVVSGDL